MRGRALPFFLGSEWGGVSASPLLLLRCLEKEKKKQRMRKRVRSFERPEREQKPRCALKEITTFFPLFHLFQLVLSLFKSRRNNGADRRRYRLRPSGAFVG